VTVTIKGHNDAPSLSTVLISASLGEDEKDVQLPVGIYATIVDPDSTSFTYSLVGTAPDGLTIDADGTVHIDSAGHYDYLASGQFAPFVVSYKVTDDSGADSNILSFKFAVTGVDDPPVATPDVVLTNNGTTTFDLPGWAVLANDKDAEGTALSVGAQLWNFTDLSLDYSAGHFTIADIAPLGATFQYAASDGKTWVYTSVNIVNQAGGDLHGTAAHEIVVGSAAGDKIDGGGGKDLIFGNDGDDTVYFHDGDVVQGGGDSQGKGTLFALTGDVLAIDHNVDFTKLDLTHFGGIEVLSTAEAGAGAGSAQSITIDASDVAKLSDHTLTGALFVDDPAININLEAVDQLYLSISKTGDGWEQVGFFNNMAVYAHETTAGDQSTIDAAVIVHAPTDPSNIQTNVHLETP
jgi:hypothetical protein